MGAACDEPKTIGGAEPKRRGRPPATTAAAIGVILGNTTSVRSRRGAVNHVYAHRAARTLFDDDGPTLVPREPAFAYFRKGAGDFKYTILAELGRMMVDDGEEAALLHVARVVANHKLPTTQAVAALRQSRLGDTTPRADRLLTGVIGVIAEHQMRYPTTPLEEIMETLAVAAASLRDGPALPAPVIPRMAEDDDAAS